MPVKGDKVTHHKRLFLDIEKVLEERVGALQNICIKIGRNS